MAVRNKIVRLAQKISGSDKAIDDSSPGYFGIECVCTDDMADVALAMDVRVPISAAKLAHRCSKTQAETERLLKELAEVGLVEPTRENGILEYVLLIFVIGSMEMLIMHPELPEKYPQIAHAFNRLSLEPLRNIAANIPLGGGALRVIPIEAAIPSGTRTAPYEELSHWLKKYECLSVGICACRKSRRLMGEGCGHLEHEMCIHVGHTAEYVINTGRGRKITYGEALDILKRAEENGLMHQVTNIDGPEKIFGICNCCRCSCFALRSSQYHNTPNTSRSNFVARVDSEKCAACGQCVENCPANAAKLGQKLCGKTLIKVKKADLPDDLDWGPERYNPGYRDSKVNVVESGTAPCKTECPAHIAIQGYIKLASQGKYTEALELIKRENPFPAVCGRICPHSCENECTRGDFDEPIAIDEIKKFIAEQDLNQDFRYIPPKMHDYRKRMAVIGSGPSGLTCAYYLAIDGYQVTVFEKEQKLGGMLTLGIPSFRLEKDVVAAEIDILRELGVEFKTGVEIGRDVTLDELRQQGYLAFYLAIGAQAGRKLGVDGENAEGVIHGVDFLRRLNLGEKAELEGNVIVIGGGNVAIDVARAATRVSAKTVAMYCLETQAEMPALDEEIAEAEQEGIAINNSWGPKRILAENGRVTGVEFKKCTSIFDADRKFAPKYDENETITVAADYVLLSIGQSIDWGGLIEGSKVELGRGNTAVADSLTLQTAQPDVFVGGDVYTGPKFAINAIVAGKQAAISMHRYVWPGQSLTIGRDRRVYQALDKGNIVVESYDRTPRQQAGHTAVSKQSFRDPRVTFTEGQLKKETQRCLGCGVSHVDDNICLGCGLCTTKCKFGAITLEKVYEQPNFVKEDLPKHVQAYAMERQKKIAERKQRQETGQPASS